MSQRDRTNRFPTARDGDTRSAGDRSGPEGPAPASDPRSMRRSTPGPRLIPERDEAPWQVDPADVDRYLDERAQAQSAPLAPRSSARPAPTGSRPATDARRTSGPAPAVPGQRRVGTPAPRPALGDPTDPSQWDNAGDGPWIEQEALAEPATETAAPVIPPRRVAPPRGRTRAARPAKSAPTLPPIPQIKIPAYITQSAIARDHTALWLLGIAAFGLGVMAALMSNQLGGLDPGLGIHVDAAGRTDRWGEPSGLWRMPLLATMITLMNGVAAWFLASTDRFAARFLLAAAVVIQLITWVAVVDFL